jgi:hypothetical protein
MAEAKTKATAQSLDEFLAASVAASRHEDCRAIAALMQDATAEPPVMWGAIVGFGRYRMQYADGREGEWPLVAFSPRKSDLTLYVMPGFDQYGDLLDQLGTHKTGKSCLYIKRLSDVDINILRKIITASVKAMAAKRIRA